ncbi:MAG: o-succinylbenzoate synthase [Actinomycetaceae bacterium]|nr:o-succinylbenzoate synthase [Actinomycetaceae bacterium]
MRIVDLEWEKRVLKFRNPVHTPLTTLYERPLILVRVCTDTKISGYGEIVSFDTSWYMKETLRNDVRALPFIREVLVGKVVAHPSHIDSIISMPQTESLPIARSGVEMAVWDAYAREQNDSLAQIIQYYYASLTRQDFSRYIPPSVPGGAVVGLMNKRDLVYKIDSLVRRGYRRIKVKVSPEYGFTPLAKVCEEFPGLVISADANRSFSVRDFFRASREVGDIDNLGLSCIEEPLKREDNADLSSFIDSLDEFQQHYATPVCIDESWNTIEDIIAFLRSDNIRCFALKASKLGGIARTLEAMNLISSCGGTYWMGGMYDAGISKSVHGALASLEGNMMPADISSSGEYFTDDVCHPPFDVDPRACERSWCHASWAHMHLDGVGCGYEWH